MPSNEQSSRRRTVTTQNPFHRNRNAEQIQSKQKHKCNFVITVLWLWNSRDSFKVGGSCPCLWFPQGVPRVWKLSPVGSKDKTQEIEPKGTCPRQSANPRQTAQGTNPRDKTEEAAPRDRVQEANLRGDPRQSAQGTKPKRQSPRDDAQGQTQETEPKGQTQRTDSKRQRPRGKPNDPQEI